MVIQKRVWILVYTLFTVWLMREVLAIVMPDGTHFIKVDYCIQSGSLIKSLQVKRLFTCAVECSLMDECRAFSFSPSNKTCHLGSDVGTDDCCSGVGDVYVAQDVISNGCDDLETSGVADIIINLSYTVTVWCDLDSSGGPWIVFLKRFDGSVQFDRELSEYESGFGDLWGEYWLGLEALYLLTRNKGAELRIDLEAYEAPAGKGLTAHALYQTFWIGDRTSGYTLQDITGYSGNAGDMEAYQSTQRGQKFTTKDNDLDQSNNNCAKIYKGGWWFDRCYGACLTCGPWRAFPNNTGKAIVYYPFTETITALKAAEMKLNLH